MLKNYGLVASVCFLILIRFVSLFSIYPGNAPDEIGHMSVIFPLTKGKILTVEENMSSYNYPYAFYNPIGYLPSVVALKVYSIFDSNILSVIPVTKDFTKKSCYVARLGNLFWFFIFLFFLIQISKYWKNSYRNYFILFVGLLPQLTFVQTYANLDSMGLAIMMYLIWAVMKKNKTHLAFSTFFLIQCKLNFLCLTPIPLLALIFLNTNHNSISKKITSKTFNFFKVFQSKQHFISTTKIVFFYFFFPLFLGSYWFFVNYFYTTGNYKSFLGFNILNSLYNTKPAGMDVFDLNFIRISLNSLFGNFGYMTTTLPQIFYNFWHIFVLVGLFFFGVCLFKKRGLHFLNYSATLVLFLNFFTHYWGSFVGVYNPQGRYLFPSGLIFTYFFIYGVSEFIKNKKNQNRILVFFLCFFCVSALVSLYVSSKNPLNIGFEIETIPHK